MKSDTEKSLSRLSGCEIYLYDNFTSETRFVPAGYALVENGNKNMSAYK